MFPVMKNSLGWRHKVMVRVITGSSQELQHSMETHFSPHPSIHLLVTLCLIAHTGAVQKNHHRLCVRVVCVSVFAPVYCCVLLPSLCCGVLMMSWPEA